MKQLKSSLNVNFYRWIKSVRNADDKINELEDRLDYYNSKLIGYKSPSFDEHVKGGNTYSDKWLLHWIFKISDTEEEIKSLKQLKLDYKRFRKGLTDIQREVLDDYYFNRKTKLKISRSYWYQVLNDINRKHNIYLKITSLKL